MKPYPPPVAVAELLEGLSVGRCWTKLAGCSKVIDARGPDRIRLADAFDSRCSAYNQMQQYQPALSDCKTAIDLTQILYAYANLGETYLGLNVIKCSFRVEQGRCAKDEFCLVSP